MKTRKIISLLVVLALAFSVAGCAASNPESDQQQQANVQDQVKSQIMVDAAWLNDNLDNVIILDTRKDTDYKKGHVPGAINAPWQPFTDMAEKQPGDAGWGVVLPADDLSAKIAALGINGEKTVVTYTEAPGWGEDGRIMWMLQMAGISDVKMLDGGWKAWKSAKYETSKEEPALEAADFEIAVMDETMDAATGWIKDNMDNIKIIDVRSPKEYNGARDYGEARGGHLPGAITIPFENMFNEDATLKSAQDLEELFNNAGLKPEDEIVTYCTAGIRSAHMALVLRAAGFENARNWDASFYEWAGDSSLPLEK